MVSDADGGPGPTYVDPTAVVRGEVRLGDGVSLWPYAVIRAESRHVHVGPMSNVQDFVMVHVTLSCPTLIGAHCSIAHHATLHGCILGDSVLVGIGALHYARGEHRAWTGSGFDVQARDTRARLEREFESRFG